MSDEKIWSMLFAGATAILMLGIMLLRSTIPPTWALLVFPVIGASLAHVASRTTPKPSQILWLEKSIITAACFVLLVLMVNGFLIDLFVSAIRDGASDRAGRAGILMVIVLSGCAALLWWAFQQRASRFREGEPGLDSRSAAGVSEEVRDAA